MNSKRTNEQNANETSVSISTNENSTELIGVDLSAKVKKRNNATKLAREMRRDKVFELSMKGYSQMQIAKQLEISQPAVHRDLQEAKDQCGKTRQEYYDLEIEQSLKSIHRKNLISKVLWQLVEDKETSVDQKLRGLSVLAKLDNHNNNPASILHNIRSKEWEEQERFRLDDNNIL